MSAFLPHTEHIVLIANYVVGSVKGFNNPKLNGTVLAREVIRSVTHRDPSFAEGKFKDLPRCNFLTTPQQYITDCSKYIDLEALGLSIADMAALVACYEYQACDSQDWEQSPAWAICQDARRMILFELQDQASEQFRWGLLDTDGLELREVTCFDTPQEKRFDYKRDLRELAQLNPSHPESLYLYSLIEDISRAERAA
tara:strand:- start:588 stop:1181 length:594 start_codon:yes stop_codon:yes gene_type:complete